MLQRVMTGGGDLLERLLRESEAGRSVDLDHLAELAWQSGLDHEAVEALIDTLERHGRSIRVDATIALRDELRTVLGAARSFAAEHGRRPTLEQLATRTGLQPNVVGRALLYGRTLAKG